jgi:hypothetical protein
MTRFLWIAAFVGLVLLSASGVVACAGARALYADWTYLRQARLHDESRRVAGPPPRPVRGAR